MNHFKRLLLFIAMVVLVTACRADTTVSIKVNESGGGTVKVSVNFDAEAWDALKAADDLRLDDLADAGWVVVGPTTSEADSVNLSASKDFDSPKAMGEVLAEVSGPDGPYSRLGLNLDESFGRSHYQLEGVLDGTMGVLGLADSEVTEALGGLPFGTDLDALEDRLGQPVGSLITLNLHVDLPGARVTDAPGWSTNLAAEVPLGVLTTSQVWHVLPLGLAAATVFFAVLFVVLVTIKLVSGARRRSKRREAAGQDSVPIAEAEIEKPKTAPDAKDGLQVVILGGSSLILDDGMQAETTEFVERVQQAGFQIAYLGELPNNAAATLISGRLGDTTLDALVLTDSANPAAYTDEKWQALANQIETDPAYCLVISGSETLLDLALNYGYPTVLVDPDGTGPISSRHSLIQSFIGLLTS